VDKHTFITEQLVNRGITNPRVLEAFKKIPREEFISERFKENAYNDSALPIGHGQTISQPYTVAYMTQLLGPKEEDTILEIGTGSGYQSAILSKLVKKVYTIEIIEELSNRAREKFKKLGITNVECIKGSGEPGLPQYAPYDGIIVTAGAKQIPKALRKELKDGGRLVIPVGANDIKIMTRITKHGDTYQEEKFGKFTFVPLVG